MMRSPAPGYNAGDGIWGRGGGIGALRLAVFSPRAARADRSYAVGPSPIVARDDHRQVTIATSDNPQVTVSKHRHVDVQHLGLTIRAHSIHRTS